MIRRILSILILFIIVVLSFAETMVWLLGTDLGISNDYLTLGVFGLSLVALIILSGGRSKNDSQKKIYIKQDKDSVIITENAVSQMVKNAISNVDEVQSSDIKIGYTKEQKIKLKVSVILALGSSIPKVTTSVEENVRQVFSGILEEKFENVEVVIKGFRDVSSGIK
ncbi:MAG: hypothetical protein FD141_1288 [Fusobacteria bacterium]|nr:MAG: hypothetical protein FD141_1288 [Fusobacteriota bacterium]KAF0230001.1 MAG: hypothetical protein FD182_391 [Fusobacteriota bacterium]